MSNNLTSTVAESQEKNGRKLLQVEAYLFAPLTGSNPKPTVKTFWQEESSEEEKGRKLRAKARLFLPADVNKTITTARMFQPKEV